VLANILYILGNNTAVQQQAADRYNHWTLVGRYNSAVQETVSPPAQHTNHLIPAGTLFNNIHKQQSSKLKEYCIQN